MKIAIFGGRFDPIHNGHVAVAQEVLKVGLVDEVWFSVENQHQWRPIVASKEDRISMVQLAIDSLGHPNLVSGSQDSRQVLRQAQDSEQSRTAGMTMKRSEDTTLNIDTTPLELGGMTETISVMRKLRQKFPQYEFVFVTGSDQPFEKWTHWDELEKEVNFLIVMRKGFIMKPVPSNAIIIDDPTYEPLEDSATRIREYIHDGKSIHGLVPQAVEDYIAEHRLYR